MRGFIDDGHLVGGGQAVVVQRGEVLANVAVGVDYLNQPMLPEHVSCVYCCSKLPIYTAILAFMQSGKAQLNTKIGELLPDANDWVGACELGQMLEQRGGFTMLDGPLSRFIPDNVRRQSPAWLQEPEERPRGTLAYSVSEVGWLSALILEHATGRHHAEELVRVLTEVLGPGTLTEAAGPITVTYQRDPETGVTIPLLNERVSMVRGQWNPSLGWYSSAFGLSQFGAALNDAWHGRTRLGSDIIRYATTPHYEPEYDAGLKTDASYGLGFWTDLSGVGFGSGASASSFGHGAQGGTSSLYVDPERELVVALCFDLAIENEGLKEVRRAPLMDAIFEVVDA